MRLHTVSLLLLALCCGGPSTAAVKVLEVKEGEDLNFKCPFYTSGHWRIFCKSPCESGVDYLVSTFIDLRTRGRYSIEYEKRPSFPDLMHVTIRNVQKSDAGLYRCGLVTFAEGNNQYKFVDVDIYVTSAQSSGSALGDVEEPRASEDQQDHTSSSDVALYVGLSLSALLILSLTLVLYWRKRNSSAPESAQTPGSAQILEVRILRYM
ncbi:uncharacterized protein LOC129409884 [Boleophthalmus pectinirostris]|uniref:uncharacterized protein LOC129409884 n=1 Tax=Boleophthalmus pectinirostris TaxID=150288 RepID=UPI00242A4994|nr:uncharacterized protein LOC129409884 [Boleophthalmus pectinirostris]